MKKTLLILVMLICFAGAHTTYAQSESFPQIHLEKHENFGLVRDVYLLFDDQAINNCWTNPSLIQKKTKLTLEQSRIPVMENPNVIVNLLHPIFYVRVIASRNQYGICFGTVEAEVLFHSDDGYGQFIWQPTNSDQKYSLDKYKTYPRPTILITNLTSFYSGTNFNSLVEEVIEGFTADFASKVIAGRRSENIQKLFTDYPELIKYISREVE